MSKRQDLRLDSTSFSNNYTCNDNIPKIPRGATIQLNGISLTISSNNLLRKEIIGQGQFGDVWLVKHEPSKLNFAMKILNTSDTNDGATKSKILNDLEISKKCQNCEFIVKAYCAIVDSRSDICIIMELLNASLDKVKSAGQRFPENMILFIIYAISTALESLHMASTIHRDVKPANILIGVNGEIKLCDFGVSGILENSCAPTNVGTSFYLPPERVNSYQDRFNIKSDVWPLGISIYELIMLRHPYESLINDIYALLKSITEGDPPRVPDNEFLYSNDLKEIVAKCIVRDSEARPSFQDILNFPIIHDLQIEDAKAEMVKFCKSHSFCQ